MKTKQLFKNNYLLLLSYVFIFIYLSFQGAIYSPDTYSYLNANIYRSPGYPIFTRLIKLVFQDNFDFMIVVIQLILSLFAIHITFKKVSEILALDNYLKIGLFLLLVFPLFNPLLVANNICSEALSYPLYLVFITFSLDFLFKNNNKSIIYLSISYVALALTRGQFLLLPIIVAFIYVLKFKKSVLKRNYLAKLLLLLFIPFVTILMDKSYHKIKDGVFISTPFKYVNAMASAFYVSDANDVNLFQDQDLKNIFKLSHDFASENNWLMSSKKRDSYRDYYDHFHDNLGRICNQTFHTKGTQYYFNKNSSIVESRLNIELAGKSMFPILIKNNFKKWITLYYSNLVHGFKSVIVLILIIILILLSAFKLLKSYSDTYATILMFSALILLNALIVSFASHSIMRYLFYNYFLFFLIFAELYKLTFINKND